MNAHPAVEPILVRLDKCYAGAKLAEYFVDLVSNRDASDARVPRPHLRVAEDRHILFGLGLAPGDNHFADFPRAREIELELFVESRPAERIERSP